MRQTAPPQKRVRWPVSEPAGFSLGGGFLVVIAATVVASLPFAPAETTARVLIMALAVFGYAACGIRITVSLATAVMAWLFGTGFLVNTAGELGFTGSDLLHLGLLVVAALGGSTCAAMRRTAARATISAFHPRSRRRSPAGPAAVRPAATAATAATRTSGVTVNSATGSPARLRERRDLQDRRAGVQ